MVILAKRTFFITLLLLALSRLALAQSVDYVVLARGGAPQLALHFISQLQPQYSDDADAWLDWESQRLQVLDMYHYWPRIIQRVSAYPDDLPADFLQWSHGLLAKAYLESGQGTEARTVLVSLLWLGDNPPQDEDQVRVWRSWLIRSYLAEGRVDDAYSAVTRFQQDYGAQQSDERLLRARILLMLKRYDEAQFLLEKDNNFVEAKALLLLVNLRTGKESPQDVIRDARWLSASDSATPVDVYLSWAVIHDAAVHAKDWEDQVLSLEHLLLFNGKSEWQGLFGFNADQLWQAYTQLALDEANKRKVLQGDDKQWFKLAQKRTSKEPHIARAIYAYLALNAGDESHRKQAVDLLAKAILGLPKGNQLYEKLYLQSSRYQDYNKLPLEARYQLIDILVNQGRVTLASNILSTQLEPPEGGDRMVWQMRSARVLILAGKPEQGIAMLRQLFKDNPKINQDGLDHIVQIAFDIQTLGQHKAAIEFFQEMFDRSRDDSFKREQLFWMADSHYALGDYEQAALLYIQSANYIVGQEYDLWGQSAFFKAADALEKAGMVDDARVIYKKLLKASTTDSQKALLRNKLQQLLLK